MIGFLRGIVRYQSPPHLILEVNNIGYEIQAPMTTFYELPAENHPVTLHTHFVVREDAHQLYGFMHQRDRDLFRALIKINGVGPKMGLNILSSLEQSHFFQAIREQNAALLTKIPGVGKKTAERLVIECRDSLKKLMPSGEKLVMQHPSGQVVEDAIEALITLGYKPQEATKTIDKIYEAGDSSQTLIRRALQHMVSGVR